MSPRAPFTILSPPHLRRILTRAVAPWCVCVCVCSEWSVNQHRDSLALYVGFDPLTQYIAVAENETIGRVKFNCLQVRRDAKAFFVCALWLPHNSK